MNLDMTGQVAVYIANEEGLYVSIREFMMDCYDTVGMTDSAAIDALSDHIELEVRDFYISGTETPAGEWVIRSLLDSVGWYELAQGEYSDFLSDMGDE
jgi:hypothetical protein